METLEDAFDSTRALVFGIGGGGDVVGTLPTARLLQRHGVETVIGGVTWERAVNDPVPGPRPFDDIEAIDRVSPALAFATADTRTHDGVEFAETHVARVVDDDVALVDINGGVEGLREGLDAACEALGVDLVVGSDSGGDALATGGEPGLQSPLADGVALAALEGLAVDSCLGVFGYGSDGELTVDELDAAVERVASRGGMLGSWGLTPRVADELDDLLASVSTEASRLPVEASRGRLGERTIREGARTLDLTPASTVTFYFDPAAVADGSDVVRRVRGSASLDEANGALEAAGYRTELTYERELAAEE